MPLAIQKVRIHLQNVSKSFYAKGKDTPVLGDITLDVYENEFLVILGAGQCGKCASEYHSWSGGTICG